MEALRTSEGNYLRPRPPIRIRMLEGDKPQNRHYTTIVHRTPSADRWPKRASGADSHTIIRMNGPLYGFDPRSAHINNDNDVKSPAAEEWLDRMIAVHNQIHDTLKRINDRRSKLFTEKSQEYEVGDRVLVDRRNLRIKEGIRALSKKWIGPYTVTEVISRHSYRLNIPKRNRLHSVIHTALLKPFHTRSAP